MVKGIRQVVDLAEEINASSARQRISVIDIGGGLPVHFESEDITPTFADYADALRSNVPLKRTGVIYALKRTGVIFRSNVPELFTGK
jgi:diaminopimelate decarboxylase